MSIELKKGDIVELEIIDISHEGMGIGKVDKLIVFVDKVVLGDKVKAKIEKKKKNYAVASLIEIVKMSEFRVASQCDISEKCGGCMYMNLNYREQLKIKERQVREKLIRLAGLENPIVKPIIALDEKDSFNYRNKVVFEISTGGNIMRKGGIIESLGEVTIGFKERKTRNVLDAYDCKIQSLSARTCIKATMQFMKEDNITAWDEKWQQGLMRHMVVRTSEITKEVMVTYVINGKGIPNGEKLIGLLDDELYDVGYNLSSVNISTKKDKVVNGEIYGKEVKLLAGREKIYDYLGDLKFEVSPRSFYQINSKLTKRLYDKVKEYADLTDEDYLLDLYCGVGSIGLYCADKAKYVVGIETVKDAIIDANRNAAINGIVNARFVCGDAEVTLPKLLVYDTDNMDEKECAKDRLLGIDEDVSQIVKNADVVILDPPRAGCKQELLDAVIRVSPNRIVYVSCDAATLARDIRYLVDNGYTFIEATPCDMFGYGGHCETVALLSKLNAQNIST